ncbi:MAG: hypothetical protein NC190_05510 [Bacteroides sp.]|nr:hypothetical protein [Bacteroides sp.]
MNPQQFFQLVTAMREAQRDYFKSRSRSALERSKHLERLVDTEIDRVKELRPDVIQPTPKTASLFGE